MDKQEVIQQALAYYNQKAGTSRRVAPSQLCQSVNKYNLTLKQCKDLIDYYERKLPTKQYFTPETIFRPTKVMSDLDLLNNGNSATVPLTNGFELPAPKRIRKHGEFFYNPDGVDYFQHAIEEALYELPKEDIPERPMPPPSKAIDRKDVLNALRHFALVFGWPNNIKAMDEYAFDEYVDMIHDSLARLKISKDVWHDVVVDAASRTNFFPQLKEIVLAHSYMIEQKATW